MKSRIYKILSVALAAALVMCCSGVSTLAAEQDGRAEQPLKAQVLASSAENSSKSDKDETVYVITDASGAAKKIIVSDWIKNTDGSNVINDKSDLSDIKNVKGDETYTLNGDNMLVWDAAGKDIYYQGETSKALPVNISVTYMLDGKEISPDDIAGKSGKVTIRFDYKNNQYEMAEINGSKEKIYVPFVMLTGVILDNESFTNIEVSNGKMINDGDRTMIAGLAFPGLAEDLNLADSVDFEIPDYVEITADAENFNIATTVTIATNDVFSKLDTDKLDSAEDLKTSMNELTGAMGELMDGSSVLYDNLALLLDKSGELVSGIDTITSYMKALSDGTVSLDNGARLLNGYIEELASGLTELSSNSTTLNNGAKQVFDTLLDTANTQLAAAGLSVPELTIDNYSTVLNSVLANLSEDAVYNLAYNTAYSKVEAAVRAQEPAVRAGVTAVVREQVTSEVINVATGLTTDEYNAAVAAGLITEEQQAMVNAGVEQQMASEAIQTAINQNTETKIQSLIDENMQSEEVTAQINAAVEQAKNGSSSISQLKAQLDSYNVFYRGLLDYTAGVDKASAGAGEILAGAESLTGATAKIKDSTALIYGGILKLQGGSGELVDGVSKLTDGAMTLSEGLKKFNDEGISKLVNLVNGDLDALTSRLSVIAEVSRNYDSFSDKSDDMQGTVKFVYRMDSIEAATAEDNADGVSETK